MTVETLDLSSCELEPIRIPAFIQAHGVLLVLHEPDLVVTQASENVGQYFGKGIVEAHGGRIWVETDSGRGATFVFTLPGIR